MTTLEGTTPRVSRYRWLICGLLLAATAINYMDRQILGLLAPLLQKDIGWDEMDYGRIVLAFQATYAVGQLGFGRLIDVLGTRVSYALAMVAWSLAAMAHALANSVPGFALVRAALGLGEAGNFPACIKAVTEWFPRQERAFATGVFNCGSNLGALVAPAIIPLMAASLGWRSTFVAIGVVGFLWLPLWWFLYDRPERVRRVSAAELAHIQQDGPQPPEERVPWLPLLRRREVWGFMLAKLLTDPIWWFYLFWLPKWLNSERGIDVKSLGLPLVAIYLLATIGSLGGGHLSSALLKRGWSANRARKTALLVCALAVVPVLAATMVGNLWLAVGLVGLAAAAHQGWSANLYTTTSDVLPAKVVASVTGLGGMAGAIGGMVFAESAGRILQATGSYWSLFAISASAYLVALGIFHVLVPDLGRRVE